MEKIIDPANARATSLTLSAPVILREGTPDQAVTEFDITAYTGAVVERWWGKLAIAVDGITAKNKMPIFREHNRDAIVGYSLNHRTEDGSFKVTGRFSKVTDAARDVAALASDGFPWQASIGVQPRRIMELDPGTSTMVNGQMLEGPAEIWLESNVFETSFVALGADDNTQVDCFSAVTEAPDPDAGQTPKKEKTMEITLSLLEEKAPELLAQIRKAATDQGVLAGAAAELSRIKSVAEQTMPGHEDLTARLMFDGETTGPEAAVQILAAEKKLKIQALENLNAGGIPPVTPSPPPATDPVRDPASPDTREAFEANKTLVDEFGDFETFHAFKQASEKGLVKILTGKKGA